VSSSNDAYGRCADRVSERGGWEWIFFINIPVGLIAFALCPVLLRESRATNASRSYDPGGALTITGALALLVYALVEAPDAGWVSVQTIFLFAGAGGAAGGLRGDRVAPPRTARAASDASLAHPSRR
jgi:hypothetical protein